ncbi:MAG: 50S ribosomal protein L37ae [Candidatus Pacearchaeota archaeon]|nr:50S ribosomal protein L37ae [Candidatus Pacearchaeota archaeon]
MARKTKKIKAAGKYRTRSGISVRKKYNAVESKQRKKQICPYCKGRVIRHSKGIWSCKKCGKKFASNAYYIE